VDGLFRETLESQKKDVPPLLHLVHSDNLKYADTIARFLTFSFKDWMPKLRSLTVKIPLLEGYLMLQSGKLADDSMIRCSRIHGIPDVSPCLGVGYILSILTTSQLDRDCIKGPACRLIFWLPIALLNRCPAGTPVKNTEWLIDSAEMALAKNSRPSVLLGDSKLSFADHVALDSRLLSAWILTFFRPTVGWIAVQLDHVHYGYENITLMGSG
jgi:hypothetical protein